VTSIIRISSVRPWSRPCVLPSYVIAIGAALVAAGCIPGFGGNASGTYVANNTNRAFLVQLVQTDGGRLTGRYEEMILKPDGKLNDLNALLTGVVDGETVAMTLQPNEIFAGSLSMSGTLQGATLHISGGGPTGGLILDLHRGDEKAFRAQVASLNGTAAKIAATRTQVEAAQRQARADEQAAAAEANVNNGKIAYVQRVTQVMTAFMAQTDLALPKFAPTEQAYRQLSSRMRTLLTREQSMQGNVQAGATRVQIAMAINQGAQQSDQIHNHAMNTRQQINDAAVALDQARGVAKKNCAEASGAIPARADLQTWKTVCAALDHQDGEFTKRVAALQAGFTKLESVWSSENANQQALVQAGTSAEN
jgi:hypothetical protein